MKLYQVAVSINNSEDEVTVEILAENAKEARAAAMHLIAKQTHVYQIDDAIIHN